MTNIAAARITSAQERAAELGAQHIGDLVSWNGARIDVPRAEARKVFGIAGAEALIPDITPTQALTRAVGEGEKPADLVVRPFESSSGPPIAHGIYRQTPKPDEAGDEFVIGARVRIALTQTTIAHFPPAGDVPPIPEAMAYAQNIAARANHMLANCGFRDISAAMIALTRKLYGAPLRDNGGFYLLPPGSCPTWAALTPGLRSIGFKPITIRMHDSPENIAAASEAAAGSLEADIAELVADLEKATTKGMRAGAIERRVALCDELTAKAELFLGVLGGAGNTITERLKALHTAFTKRLETEV